MFGILNKKSDNSKVHSSFWLGEDWDVGKKGHRTNADLVRLAAAKRSIGNFVNILVPGKGYKVVFNTSGDSYTDGKTVTIGADVDNPKDFDVNVGLALHEASHLLLTDFSILPGLGRYLSTKLVEKAEKVGISEYQLKTIVKTVLNIIEDRRIDNYVYRTTPGYQEYYLSLYDKYFNSPAIDKLLLSGEYRDETWECYEVWLANLVNPNFDRNALKKLGEICDVIRLDDIDRLKSTTETLTVSLEVVDIILGTIDTQTPHPDEGDGDPNGSAGDGDDSSGQDESQSMNGDGEPNGSAGGGDGDDSSGQDESQSMNGDGEGSESDGDSNSDSSNGDAKDGKSTAGNDGNPSAKTAKKRAENAINKQRKFINGSIRKRTISKEDQKSIQQIQESGTSIVNVGEMVRNKGYYSSQHKGIDCVVVKKMTRSLMKSVSFPLASVNPITKEIANYYEKEIIEGIKLGKILGKKLQVRGEERDTVYNRQSRGKIDKRMVNSLGYGNENVFYNIDIDSYKKANLHISIDASSSMSGDKWSKTMINVVALCKAVDMIRNLEVQVTFRSTQSQHPYVVLAYDSRVDKFSKVRELFPALRPSGTTPEGLVYEAIMNNFVKVTNDIDSYFLNISDGEPYFGGTSFFYGGASAAEHTKLQVNQIRSRGIQVLSYFIEEHHYIGSGSPSEIFIKMYGKDAKKIDVTNAREVVKTMNQLFLRK